MDQNSWTDNKNLRGAVIILLSLGALFLLVKTLKEVKTWSAKAPGMQEHVISVSGKGEITAIADIATFSFSATEIDKTVKDAQEKATAKNNQAIKFLKDNGIDEKDIKTTDYNIYPQYGSMRPLCEPGESCPQGTQQIIGYQVSQTVQVKVRDASKAGDMLSGLGAIGVSNVSNLQFTVDDQDELAHKARTEAIKDAQKQAEKLASDLGVRLGSVVSFSENSGGGYPMPYYADKAMGQSMGAEAPRVAPQVPTGQNKITTYVTISYEIK